MAEALADTVQTVLRRQAVFTFALSGGNTPRALYILLAREYAVRIDWSRVHLFWSDERYVPYDHPASNYRMAYETLIATLAIPLANVHPFPTDDRDPLHAAQRYEAHLRDFFGDAPRLDLVLLGMGADGHTASLFPNTAALVERERWVAVGQSLAEPRLRLTLTLPVLNSATAVYFLVSGADKAQTLRKILVEDAPLPAGQVQPRSGELVWWLDREAAALL